MKDSSSSLDYGERLVMRYRASGLVRKDFAERAGISVSTLEYYVRRERKASLPAAAPFTIDAVSPSIPAEAPRALLAAAASMLDRLVLTLLIDALALFVSISTTSSSLLSGTWRSRQVRGLSRWG